MKVWVEMSLCPHRRLALKWEGRGRGVPGKGRVALQLPWTLEVPGGHLGRTRPRGAEASGALFLGLQPVSLASHGCSVGTQAT